MAVPEFIYLNEQAVRVTAWQRDNSTGAIDFVVIAKGERDRDQLLDLMAREPVMVRIGSNSAIPMEVRSLETRSSGEGTRSIHRLELTLAPEGVDSPASPERPRVVTQEQQLERIIKLLTDIRNEMREIRNNQMPE